MKLKVHQNGKEYWLEPKEEWQDTAILTFDTSFEADPNFYIMTMKPILEDKGILVGQQR
jgi:hypothetical protein